MLPPRLPLALQKHVLRVAGGVELLYYTTKAPFEDAPRVVLANGLGGHYVTWASQIEQLSNAYQFVTWDYRGLFGSSRPSPDVPEAYAIERHADDLLAIMDAEKIDRAALIGWSMGVQVVLEAYRKAPSRATCLVLLNGTSGKPLDTVAQLPGVKNVLPSLVEVCRRAHTIASQVTRKAASLPEALGWLKAMGLIGDALNESIFVELIQGFSGLNMEAYFQNLRALGEHDASDVLGKIEVPTLVLSGDKDAMTPPALAREIASKIPGAELYIVPGGSHYTAVEFPELVSLRLAKFLGQTASLPSGYS